LPSRRPNTPPEKPLPTGAAESHFYGRDDDDLSFVLTVCRDGTLELTDSDRRWLRVLQWGIREYAAPVRMLCLATPEGVRELGPAF
jgi:hypothetical protein